MFLLPLALSGLWGQGVGAELPELVAHLSKHLLQGVLILEQQHRPPPLVLDRDSVEHAACPFHSFPATHHPSCDAEGDGLQGGLHAVLVPHAVLHHLKLKLTNSGQDRILSVLVQGVEHLDSTLTQQTLHTLVEGLFHGWGAAHVGKQLRGEGGDGREVYNGACAQSVSDGERPRVSQANNVTGEALNHSAALICKHALWCCQCHHPPCACYLDLHALFEFP
mmetsp:Transcript_40250/g.89376  ORF Transcript_40250/g.89376 Transcript_40250/m.89376 type:complete len:222 (-) Transcript_40250:1360-2025(-)